MKHSTDYAVQSGTGIGCMFALSGYLLWLHVTDGAADDLPEWSMWAGSLFFLAVGAALCPVALKRWRQAKRWDESDLFK